MYLDHPGSNPGVGFCELQIQPWLHPTIEQQIIQLKNELRLVDNFLNKLSYLEGIGILKIDSVGVLEGFLGTIPEADFFFWGGGG